MTLSLKRKGGGGKTNIPKTKCEVGMARKFHGKSTQGIDSRSAISLCLSCSRFVSQESTARIPLLSLSLTVIQGKDLIGKEWKLLEANRTTLGLQ